MFSGFGFVLGFGFIRVWGFVCVCVCFALLLEGCGIVSRSYYHGVSYAQASMFCRVRFSTVNWRGGAVLSK